jgi:hypothetical protein
MTMPAPYKLAVIDTITNAIIANIHVPLPADNKSDYFDVMFHPEFTNFFSHAAAT